MKELAIVLNLMRTHAIRRIPVVDHGEVVGVLTLGDLAVAPNGDSVLAEISAANPTPDSACARFAPRAGG